MDIRTAIIRIIVVTCSAILAISAGAALAAGSNSKPDTVKPVITNLRQVRPRYPEAASRERVQGNILMQFRLSEKGKPRDIKVLLAEPQGVFERNALSIASRLRFSVPAEWLAANPNRILDFGIQFLIDSCPTKDIFPGIKTIQIYDFSVNSTQDAYKLMDACKKLRESGSTTDQQNERAAVPQTSE